MHNKVSLLLCCLLPLSLSSCADSGNRREFYYFFNEQYKLNECADLKDQLPNEYPYMNMFKEKTVYTHLFDTTKSILELRVEVDPLNKPHGYGFIKLYSKNGNSVIDIDVSNYIATQIDYHWGYFKYNLLSESEYVYELTKELVRFRYPVYIEEEGAEKLITFNYGLSKTYEYPEEFKDLSWMV